MRGEEKNYEYKKVFIKSNVRCFDRHYIYKCVASCICNRSNCNGIPYGRKYRGGGETDWTIEEEKFQDVEVTYKQSASYLVTIPKTIALGMNKQAAYSVKVSGDIDTNQRVYVAPVDGITDTENIDFYMKDQTADSKKADVVATVTQNKFYWNSEEVTAGYEETNNSVSAPQLTAGTWKGTFQVEINLQTMAEQEHNYVTTITKEPTCTEAGEKTYTCNCGDSCTEEIPAKGHNFENGECTDCGEKDSCSESHTDENGDDICDICGHEHQWQENEDVLEWVRYNPYGRTDWIKNGNTYEATVSADKTDATKSASIDFDIDAPNDVECTYSFTCPYLYKTDFMYYDNAWAFLYDLDDSGNTIDTTSNPRTTIFDVKGAGSGNSSGKIFLSKGKHRLSVLYHKGNKSSAVSGTVRITLDSINDLNYVCTECGERKGR